MLQPGEGLDDLANSGLRSVAPTVAHPLLGADEVFPESGDSEVKLSRWALMRWCRGKLSAPDVIDCCMHAPKSDHDPLAKQMAGIDPRNAHRGLMSAIKRHVPANVAPLYWANIPMYDETSRSQKLVPLPFCLPHEWLADMASADPEAWAASTPELQKVVEEWRQRVHAPADDGKVIAPLTLWGDSAPYHTGTDSVDLLLWGGANKESRNWITVISQAAMCRCGCGGKCTLVACWRVVNWSFQALLAGVYPLQDHEGNAFSEPWRIAKSGMDLPLRGACVQFRGDWPWLSYCFDVNYHSNKFPCFLCGASKEDEICPFTDPGLSATWRSTCVTHDQFLRQRFVNRQRVSAIFGLPGFRMEYILLDFMHMCDLGATQVAVGNCLWELFLEVGGTVGDPAEALAELVKLLKATGQRIGMDFPFSLLKLKHIRSGVVPRLRAKAAKGRAVARIVTACMEEFFGCPSKREETRLLCMKQLVSMYDIMENWDQDSQAALEIACRKHLLLFLELSKLHADDPAGWVRWRWYPKHHMLLHLTGDQAKRMGNPRSWWCYQDEGQIGMAARICESVHIATLSKTCMEKYLVLLRLNRM